MDGNKKLCVRSDEIDRFSNLPENLIFEILLKLPTKDVVKTSLFSKRWRNLWKYVPNLDLKKLEFPDYNAYMSFVDRFLGFNSECLQNFKLESVWNGNDKPDLDRFVTWINAVVDRKVRHFHYLNILWWKDVHLEIPLTVYTCESLVSLKLSGVILPNPVTVSLPSLKDISLRSVEFANDLAFEMLISGCPVLESLVIGFCDDLDVLRVCSQSLLSLTLLSHREHVHGGKQVVAIDAPMLEYLQLSCCGTGSFIIKNSGSLAKLGIDIVYNLNGPDMSVPRNLIGNFLTGISNVKVMDISSRTLEVIYDYSRYEQLPLFRNLSSLCAKFFSYYAKLSIFLEKCPNLKSLSLDFSTCHGGQPLGIISGPPCFLPALEFVEILKLKADTKVTVKLASYFLHNSAILKKITLLVDSRIKHAIREKLIAIPRLSTSCLVVVHGFMGW